MSDPVSFRSAVRSDRSLLPDFECAEKGLRPSILTGWKSVPPNPWEYAVQSAARGLRPPLVAPHFMIVGVDDLGIAAICCYTEDSGPEQVHVELAAVASRHRRTTLKSVARGLAEEVQARIFERAYNAGIEKVLVTANVHRKNTASHDFCQRMDFERQGSWNEDYEVWAAEHYLLF